MRDDDFMPPDTYRKGKGKATALKPWQSSDGQTVTQTKQRCWDGLHGCEQFKGFDQFKWHRRVCTPCVIALCSRFNAPQGDVDYLLLLLWQENSLFKAVKELGAKPEKIQALHKAQEHHIGHLLQSVLKIRTLDDGRATIKAYRDWFHDQAGVEVTRAAAHPKGMVSVAKAAA